MIENKYRYIFAFIAMAITTFIFWAGGHDYSVRTVENGFCVLIIIAMGFMFFICPYFDGGDND